MRYRLFFRLLFLSFLWFNFYFLSFFLYSVLTYFISGIDLFLFISFNKRRTKVILLFVFEWRLFLFIFLSLSTFVRYFFCVFPCFSAFFWFLLCFCCVFMRFDVFFCDFAHLYVSLDCSGQKFLLTGEMSIFFWMFRLDKVMLKCKIRPAFEKHVNFRCSVMSG